MSKITCLCGHVISDLMWPLSHDSGSILCDEDEAQLFTCIAEDLSEFLIAVQRGAREEWLHKYFGPPQSPSGEYDYYDRNDEIIADFLALRFQSLTRIIDQCNKCGRLLVQTRPSENKYRFFAPEGEWDGILQDIGSTDKEKDSN